MQSRIVLLIPKLGLTLQANKKSKKLLQSTRRFFFEHVSIRVYSEITFTWRMNEKVVLGTML